MPAPVEILNGDDRPHALRTLKRAVKGARGADKTHLASVLRSLNPDAARSRAFKGGASMAKRTKKAAHHRRRRITRKGNPTSIRRVATKAKERVRVVTRRAASNFKGLDLMGLLKEGAGIGVGMIPDYMMEEGADLVTVLTEIDPPVMPILFVYPEELKTSKKVQVLRDFLVSKARQWKF